MSDFPPIADYAFLSDCEDSCLIAADGSVEWLCLPRPDSPSVFGALLDRSAGSFRFGPSNTWSPTIAATCRAPWWSRRPGTPRPVGSWSQDLMVVRKVDDGTRRPGYRRAPTDSAAAGVLLRTATCVSGKVEVDRQLRTAVRLRNRHRALGLRRRRLRLPHRPAGPTAT